MENEKDLKYSWGPFSSRSSFFSSVCLPGVSFVYRTEKIAIPTNTDKAREKTHLFLKETIEKYLNHKIEGGRLVKTSYRLGIAWEGEKDEKPKEKDLYTAAYKIKEEEKILIEETIFNYLYPETIQPNFYIFLVCNVRYIQQKPNFPECLVCLNNNSQVVYIDCLHVVVCASCDILGKLDKCPLCRREIKNQRIHI